MRGLLLLAQRLSRLPLAVILLLLVVLYTSCGRPAPLSITHNEEAISLVYIHTPQRYLLLPIEEATPEVEVRLQGEAVYQDIRLAVDSVDYYVPYPLGEGKGERILEVRGLSRDAVAWDSLKLSDVFDTANTDYYRPSYHHTPPYGWMNDPNGLVYHEGEYHLFYQYNPYGSRWGNMHWGHSVSKDLLHWEALPLALAPDTLGAIFSGSCVVDRAGDAGFGKGALLAFYTAHAIADKRDREDYKQAQCLAYSLDNGITFTKYEGNPILHPLDGIKDFRDPKVFRYNDLWYMIVSADKEMRFFSSTDLRHWSYLSSFGKGWGMFANQFECPDFFELPVEGAEADRRWVMLVNINPGSPWGGSATAYFVGQFDGERFVPDHDPSESLWLDWGKDHYAAITFGNMPRGKVVSIPWISNWQYAHLTPQIQHRGANGLPRKHSLYRLADGSLRLASTPIDGLATLRRERLDLSQEGADLSSAELLITIDSVPPQGEVEIALSNLLGEELLLRLDLLKGHILMDRTRSGVTAFGRLSEPHRLETSDHRKTLALNYQDDFALSTHAPLSLLGETGGRYELRLFLDKSSAELFVNGGRIAMTNQIFPTQPYTRVRTQAPPSARVRLEAYRLAL